MFEGLVQLLDDPVAREVSFEWGPYVEAVEWTGIPHLEELLGFVPLLVLGGAPVAANLQRMDFWEHIALIAQTVGLPQLRGFLRIPEAAAPPAVPVDRSSLSGALDELAAAVPAARGERRSAARGLPEHCALRRRCGGRAGGARRRDDLRRRGSCGAVSGVRGRLRGGRSRFPRRCPHAA
jgi:hypothetical protein